MAIGVQDRWCALEYAGGAVHPLAGVFLTTPVHTPSSASDVSHPSPPRSIVGADLAHCSVLWRRACVRVWERLRQLWPRGLKWWDLSGTPTSGWELVFLLTSFGLRVTSVYPYLFIFQIFVYKIGIQLLRDALYPLQIPLSFTSL